MSLPEKESAPISKSGNPLAACSRIVILTGAGISAESGLPTFRGKDGLWEGRRFEEVATPEAFARDPDQVHRFYNHRRRQLANVAPNAAHRALAELECRRQGDLLVVTQNVDDLHERAGQRRLIHMHGQLDRARCLSCGWAGAWNGDLGSSDPCPGCARSSRLRPDIVWFGEVPTAMDPDRGGARRLRPVRGGRHLG